MVKISQEIIYELPSVTLRYIIGDDKLEAQWHNWSDKKIKMKVDSKRGRYLVSLIARKGEIGNILSLPRFPLKYIGKVKDPYHEKHSGIKDWCDN